MIFKIYNKRQKLEKEIHFKLSTCTSSLVVLEAVDRAGNRLEGGSILSISERGLHLYEYMDKEIGLPLDKRRGTIKIVQ